MIKVAVVNISNSILINVIKKYLNLIINMIINII